MRNVGHFYELVAADFLRYVSGHKIIRLNWFSKFGEVDIVTQLETTIFLHEVKHRTSTSFGFPSEYVSRRKIINMKRFASLLLARKEYQDFSIELCVIEILAPTETFARVVVRPIEL